MARVEVYGVSDDLIEVEGAIAEEFSAYYAEDGRLLAFSDGTVLRIAYGRGGVWRVFPVVRGSAALTITQAPEGDEDNYSDRAVIEGELRWVVCGEKIARAKEGL